MQAPRDSRPANATASTSARRVKACFPDTPFADLVLERAYARQPMSPTLLLIRVVPVIAGVLSTAFYVMWIRRRWPRMRERRARWVMPLVVIAATIALAPLSRWLGRHAGFGAFMQLYG